MHAMKQALKNHMAKAKMGKPEISEDPIKMDKESEEKERGDKAPELMDHKMLMSSELGPEHMDLLKELLSQISHPGRDAMSLEERSAPMMKEKMASIMKHKKSI